MFCALRVAVISIQMEAAECFVCDFANRAILKTETYGGGIARLGSV